jgi:hypothetical protein
MKEEFLKLDSVKPCRIRNLVPQGLGKQLKPNFFMERLRIFHNHLSTKQKYLKQVAKFFTGISYGLACILILFGVNKNTNS